MMVTGHYVGFKPIAEFGIVAEGGTAVDHMMPAKDVLDTLSAMANIARRTTLLCLGRPSPSVDDLGNFNVMIYPPAKGSFLMGVVVGFGANVASNVAANLATPHAEKALKNVGRALTDVWSVALGRTETNLDQRVEPYFEHVNEVGEKLHSSFQQLANPVDDSVEQINLYGCLDRRESALASIDRDAKRELSQEIVSDVLESFNGRVRQLNDRTCRGIIYASSRDRRRKDEGEKSFRFWVNNPANEPRIVAALAQNLAANNAPRDLLSDLGIRVTGRRVTTLGGRTKRVLIEDIGR